MGMSVRNVHRKAIQAERTPRTRPHCLPPSHSVCIPCTDIVREYALDSYDKLPSPEVVAADETLETGPDAGRAVVLTHLDCLVHPAIAITEVCALGSAKVNAKAFFGAARARHTVVRMQH